MTGSACYNKDVERCMTNGMEDAIFILEERWQFYEKT